MRKPPADGFEGVPSHVLAQWKELAEPHPERDPGPEWMSSAQLAALWGVSAATARRRVNRAIAMGVVVKQSYRDVIDGAGRRFPIPVYRIMP